MKKISMRLFSAVLTLCMLFTMLSCVFGITASADEVTYDSGNMPSWVFDQQYWNEKPNQWGDKHIYTYNLSDKSIRFTAFQMADFGTSLSNSEVTFDAKASGDWSIVFRYGYHYNDQNYLVSDEGYAIGYVDSALVLRRISGGKETIIGRCSVGNDPTLYKPMKWQRYNVRIEDYENYSVLKLTIDGKPIPFVENTTFSPNTGLVAMDAITTEQEIIGGNLYDFDPISRDNTGIAFRPERTDGNIIINRNNALYLRSVDTDLTDAADPFRIVFVGDSITHGALVRHDETWAKYMNDLLGNSYDCHNAGVSAAAAFSSAGYGFPYKGQNQFTYASNIKGDITVFMLGTNDAKYIKDYNSNIMFEGEALESKHKQFLNDYGYIIKNCMSDYNEAVICAPPFTYHEEWTDETIRKMGEWTYELYEQLNETYPGRVHYFDMYSFTYEHEYPISQGIVNEETGKVDASWYDDKLHPNKVGYQAMAAKFYDWLVNESGISLEKSAGNTATLTTPDNSALIGQFTQPLTSYNGTFNTDYFVASCSGYYSKFTTSYLRYLDGGVGAIGGAVSIPEFNLGQKWTMNFGYNGPSAGGSTVLNGEFNWNSYRYVTIRVGGLELRMYRLKADGTNPVLVYRLFMNNIEIADPYISSAYIQNQTYQIDYSFGSVKIVRTNDNEVLFDIGSKGVESTVGYGYKFDGVRVSLMTFESNVATTWNSFSIHANEIVPTQYTIDWNENGHIDLNGNVFDNTSTRYIDERITLTAVCDTYGYMFVKWVDGDGNKLSTNPEYDLIFTEEPIELHAVFGPFRAYSELFITAGEGGSVLFNGAPYNYNDDYLVGDVVELTAVADNGYTFGYWTNGKGEIISTEPVWNYTLANVSECNAVFFKSGSDATVIFYGRGGKVAATYTVAVGSELTLPALPYSFGYVCKGWNIDGNVLPAGSTITVNGDTVVSAAFQKEAAKYTVTVNGGKINNSAESGAFAYNTLITVVFDESVLADGEVFGGWHVEGTAGAAVISYDTAYTFYVGSDVNLSAVISASASNVKPVTEVTNVSLVENGKKVTFLTERTLPEGYTLVESGVVYTADANNADSLTLDGLCGTVFAKKASYSTPNGQYRLTVSSRDGSEITVYLVSYLIYLDKAGDKHIVYSDVYTGKTVSSTGSQDIIEDANDRF